MTKIDELIKFKPKTKAVADEVNSNFEKLLVACNEHDDSICDIQTQINELKSNNTQEIICENNVLELMIQLIILKYSENLQLQK